MNSKQKIELLKNRNISMIITDTISFTRANFKPLFSGLFYICSPAFLLLAVGVFLFYKGYFSIISHNFRNPARTNPFDVGILNEFLLLIPFLILFLLGLYFAMCFVITVSYSYVKLYKQDQEITTGALWDTSKKYIWKVIGSQFLLTLIVAVAYLICCLPLFLALSGEMFLGFLGIFLTIILFLIFMVVCIYFYTKLSFYLHFLIVEDKKIMESFKLSYQFSKGIFWRVFLCVFVFGLIVSMCGYIFQLPGTILTYSGMILGFTDQKDSYSIIFLLGSALSGVGMAISYTLYSILYIGISFIYYSTLEERFGIKSEEEIDSIGKREELN